MRRVQTTLAVCSSALVIFLAGCSTVPPEDKPNATGEDFQCSIAKLLQPVEESRFEWGKVTISCLTLVPDSGQFALDYTQKPEEYVAKARQGVQATASSQLVESVKTELGGGVTGPPLPAVQPSTGSKSATNSSGGSSSGSASQSNSGGTTTTVSIADKSSAADTQKGTASPSASKDSSKGQTQAGAKTTVPTNPASPTLSERMAMSIGLNDKLSEIALTTLANPPADKDGMGELFLGIFEVTCQPGNRTWKDYIADVNVSLEYYGDTDALKKSSILEHFSNQWEQGVSTYPDVLAVLPLMDSRSMDLSNTRSSTTELALRLAAELAMQGSTAQANYLTDYVRRHEVELKSRTAQTTVTTYSDGRSFGFQIYPAFQPMDDPAAARAYGANVLQPICFPAAVLLRVDKTDLEVFPKGSTISLVWHVQTRWIPKTFPSWIDRGAPLPWFLRQLTWPFHSWDPLYRTVEDRFGDAQRLEKATAILMKWQSRIEDEDSRINSNGLRYQIERLDGQIQQENDQGKNDLVTQKDELEKHMDDTTVPRDRLTKQKRLQEQERKFPYGEAYHDARRTLMALNTSGGTTLILDIANPECECAGKPKPAKPPTINEVVASTGFVNGPTVFPVKGCNFWLRGKEQCKPAAVTVTLGGRECDCTIVDDQTLIVTVPAYSFNDSNPKSPPPDRYLTVTTSGGSARTDVKIKFAQILPNVLPFEPSITIGRDQQGKVTAIKVEDRGTMADDNLLGILKEILVKSEAPAAEAGSASGSKDSAGSGKSNAPAGAPAGGPNQQIFITKGAPAAVVVSPGVEASSAGGKKPPAGCEKPGANEPGKSGQQGAGPASPLPVH